MYASSIPNASTAESDKTADKKKLTFFVSGKLWGRSLVMEDKETGSEWSHILGRAMAGQMKGTTLEVIPSVMTNWKSWVEKHPNTTATKMKPSADGFDTEMLHLGREFGLGLVHAGEARFWRFDQMQEQPVINDELAKLQIAVSYDIKSRTPIAWNRKTPDGVLTFRAGRQGVQDVESNSSWDLQLGMATDGPLKGMRLQQIPAIVSFTDSWMRFHPNSTRWKPPGN